MSTGALITGNTVVFKPSSTDNMTMLSGIEIYKVFRDAGVPAGVFNYVTGPGSEVGDELAINPMVGGIAFTGSKSTGIGMLKKSYDAGLLKPFVVEMGGKNPAIVSKYANLDYAVSGIASAAFGFCGQKCSATSRVYVHESVKEQFISKLLDKVRTFKVGNPLLQNFRSSVPVKSNALHKKHLSLYHHESCVVLKQFCCRSFPKPSHSPIDILGIDRPGLRHRRSAPKHLLALKARDYVWY